MSKPEVWLRGPVPELPPALQPVAHSLLQSAEDLPRLLAGLTPEQLHARPGASASIAFHVRHLVGSLDRLLTYARGDQLDERQRAQLAAEQATSSSETAAELTQLATAAIAAALALVHATAEEALDEARAVGRAGLPSTVRGLLFHAAEHTLRHAGQVSTLRQVLSR